MASVPATVAEPARQPFTIPIGQGPAAPAVDRAFAAVFGAAAIAGVALLLPLEPDARGFDTHVQLGLDPCGWPTAYGMPCPTCGCTTAACLVVHGRVFAALAVQPFGALLAAAGILLGAHGLACLVRRRSFLDVFVRLPFWRIVGAGVLTFFAAWGYKCLVFAL